MENKITVRNQIKTLSIYDLDGETVEFICEYLKQNVPSGCELSFEYEGSEIGVIEERLETDKEFKIRISENERKRQQKENQEREQYLKLKAKFDENI